MIFMNNVSRLTRHFRCSITPSRHNVTFHLIPLETNEVPAEFPVSAGGASVT